MKRKFVKVMFFGALALSTVTYVGCKDYDDDIDNLQTQIDANKASIADLQKFVNEGKWVKNVESITGGFKVTFNDGKSYDIVNGADGAKGDKGDKGDTGATGAPGAAGSQGTPGSKVTIDKETGEWLINDEGTGWYATVEDGHSPYIADGTNGDKGYWYFWDNKANNDKGDFVKGDKAQGEPGESIVGQNGKSPYLNADGFWVYYDEAGEEVLGPKAAGTTGMAGKDAFSPFIGSDGYWYFWDVNVENEDGSKGKVVRGAYAQTSVYIVEAEGRPAWELHIGTPNEDGTYTDKTIILPTADKLSNMTVVSITDGKISEGMSEVTMYYGILAKGTTVKFNGVTYGSTTEATTLVGANSSSFHALINPVSVDFSEYPVDLINSHGDVCYTVGAKVKNMSEEPLTRAEDTKKWNQGIYDLNVSLIASKAADNSLNGKKIAYALRAKDAWGNDIISNYDVKIVASNQAFDIKDAKADVVYTSPAKLDELFAGELAKVAAHYYTIEKTALEAIGATFDEATNTISAPTKQGSIAVKVSYLKTDGTKVEESNAKTFTVNFTYNTGDDITITDAVVWNLTKGADAADMSKNASSITIKSTDPLFAILNKEFTDNKKPTVRLKSVAFAAGEKITVNGNEYTYADGSIALAATQPEAVTDSKGNVTGYKITFNFAPDKVAAVMHNAVLEVINPDYSASSGLNDEVIKKANVKVEVKNAGIFAFVPLSAYFTGSNTAIAYGTPDNASIVNQDLYALFDVISAGDKTHITFAEEVPNFGTTEKPVLGEKWLAAADNSEIAVPLYKAEKNDGVYSTRSLTIAYQPFGNERLATISKTFNLTVRSAIKQGSHPDITKDKVLSIKEKSFNIKPSDFTVKDVYDKAVTIASKDRDTRVTDVIIELSSEIAQYAEIKDQTASPVAFGDELTVQLKANTVSIASEVKGYALVKITDTWGAVTEVKCPIVMKADGAK